jgi:hypothetical protein
MAKDNFVTWKQDERQILLDADVFLSTVDMDVNKQEVRIVAGGVVAEVLWRIVWNNIGASFTFDLIEQLGDRGASQLQTWTLNKRVESGIEDQGLTARVYFRH